jgi:hypothetical protein
MLIYALIHSFIFFSSFVDFSDKKFRVMYLYFIGIFFVFFIGLRGNSGMDTLNYIDSFNNHTGTIWDWKDQKNTAYVEQGFYYLSVLLKSILNNTSFYFFIISCMTIFPLVSSLRFYCVYPILGFSVYFARFLIARDMNQIRAALAIAIVIYALKYLRKNDLHKYIVIVLMTIFIHRSMIIALLFLFVYKLKISFRNCIFLLLISAVIGIEIGNIFKPILLLTNLIIFLRYVGAENLGLLNPVLYYQSLLCLLFFYFEDRLSKIQKGYYVLRNAYLFSTSILLLTCNLGEIGGRLATLFATCEIFIVPSLVHIIRPRIIGYIIMSLIIALLFYLNYNKLSIYVEAWTYKPVI